MQKNWTEGEIEFLKYNYQLLTIAKICEKLNRTESSVKCRAKKLGLKVSQEEKNKRAIAGFRFMSEKNTEKKQANKKKKFPFKGYSLYAIAYFANANRKKRKRGHGPNMDLILKDICEVFNYPIEEIKGHSQKFEYVAARQIFCYVCKLLHPKISYTDISEFLGYTSHSMAIRGCKVIGGKIKVNDPSFIDDWFKYIKETKVYK